MRDRLAAEIEKTGRAKWAGEEFARLVGNLESIPKREVNVLKFKGARQLTPRQLAILQKLLEWRERKAKGFDVPNFKIIGNERLLKLAQAQPRGRRELEDSWILSPRQLARFGNEIIAAVEKGMRVPAAKFPHFPQQEQQRRDLAAERILRNLKVVRDRKAAELELDPGFLMPNAVLKAVAKKKPRNMAEMQKSGLLKEWQLEIMGESLVEAIRRAT